MSKKRLVAFLSIFLVCLFIVPSSTMASHDIEIVPEDHDVKPMWNYIDLYSNYFDISSSGKAIVEVMINSLRANQLSVEAYLEQYKNGVWTTIKSWSSTTYNEYDAYVSKVWYVEKGYYYRLRSIGKAYVNGNEVESTVYVSNSIYY